MLSARPRRPPHDDRKNMKTGENEATRISRDTTERAVCLEKKNPTLRHLAGTPT